VHETTHALGGFSARCGCNDVSATLCRRTDGSSLSANWRLEANLCEAPHTCQANPAMRSEVTVRHGSEIAIACRTHEQKMPDSLPSFHWLSAPIDIARIRDSPRTMSHFKGTGRAELRPIAGPDMRYARSDMRRRYAASRRHVAAGWG
jgi:hypothetical protein